MSTEEKLDYILKTEYDLSLVPENIDNEINANIEAESCIDDLKEWAEVLWERCADMRELCGIYGQAAERAENRIEWLENSQS